MLYAIVPDDIEGKDYTKNIGSGLNQNDINLIKRSPAHATLFGKVD